jgi:hypothetical protein
MTPDDEVAMEEMLAERRRLDWSRKVTARGIFRHMAEEGFSPLSDLTFRHERSGHLYRALANNDRYFRDPESYLPDALATIICRDAGLGEPQRLALIETLKAFADVMYRATLHTEAKQWWEMEVDEAFGDDET